MAPTSASIWRTKSPYCVGVEPANSPAGEGRRVRRREREVDEERFPVARGGALGEEGDGLLREARLHVLHLEIAADRPRATASGPGCPPPCRPADAVTRSSLIHT
jgi:hypothetical protein